MQDEVITESGESPTLGKYIAAGRLRQHIHLHETVGDIAKLYPVLSSCVATRSPLKSERIPARPQNRPRTVPRQCGCTATFAAVGSRNQFLAGIGSGGRHRRFGAAELRCFSGQGHPPFASERRNEVPGGPRQVYLHSLQAGVQVIASTVLGHIGSGGVTNSEPHMLFQIRPTGSTSPLIDPKPILDGWVLLERTSIYKAKGADPFAAKQTDRRSGAARVKRTS